MPGPDLLECKVNSIGPLVSEHPGSLTLKIGANEHKFNFEKVYHEQIGCKNDWQSKIYHETAHSFVEHVLEGYNCCLMAYGPTGSGKTYRFDENLAFFGQF